LDVVRVCAICAKDHATEQCPSLPGLKVVFKEEEEETKPVYLMAHVANGRLVPQVCYKILPLSFLGSIINNKILETHGRANHFLTLPGSPNNILLHPGQINQLQIPPGQINQLQIPPGLTRNTLPHLGRIQIITPILHSGLTQLPKPPIGIKTGSAPWG
jgi:hypothetical protein